MNFFLSCDVIDHDVVDEIFFGRGMIDGDDVIVDRSDGG